LAGVLSEPFPGLGIEEVPERVRLPAGQRHRAGAVVEADVLGEPTGGRGVGVVAVGIIWWPDHTDETQDEVVDRLNRQVTLVVTDMMAQLGFDVPDDMPGIADGTLLMAFGITEADAGSNAHNITTTGTRDGDQWVLNGQKTFISGVDEAQAVLIVARTQDAKTGKLKPALFVVPTDAPGFTKQPIPMAWSAPEKQFTLFFDDVRLPADALVGDEDGGLWQLFAGLNPERIMGAALSCGMARFAIEKSVEYAKTRRVWKDQPIGAHQGIQHPIAKVKIELEQARLLWQKAAALYDAGDDFTAGEYANMAKYAGGEVSCNAADVAVHTHGGNGLTVEYGLGNLLVASRLGRIAPVSREMILNFVAMHTLGLPKSY
jgi:alkylation response protein AidB-like acyl-CoA dehydrogenase